MNSRGAAIVWFRRDLRLEDNAALAGALAGDSPVIPLFIWDQKGEGEWPLGAASKWWLHHSLTALDEALRGRGSRLVVATGSADDVLAELARVIPVRSVHWNRCWEPAARAMESRIARRLDAAGVDTVSHNSALLFEPPDIANRAGGPFQVFSPFWRHCLALPVAEPVKLPSGPWKGPQTWPRSEPIAALELLPTVRWDAGFAPEWTPGESGARVQLKAFLGAGIEHYDQARNLPGQAGTSRLSPYLHFGELGPRQIWAAVRRRSRDTGVFPAGKGDQVYLSEIGWREFAYHLLYHFPETPTRPLRAAFAAFPWAEDRTGDKLRAWQRGLTGYPIVDAGMRQLWQTGWMHNRVRMIVASFLVKHLRLPWSEGSRWFWDTLVDADLASNTLNWQWSAGCGADAAPYFRIFAPVLQGQKFDSHGAYVRRWVPEIKGLPDAHLHAPWETDAGTLERAGIVLGRDYPKPIVDHARARAEALQALKQLNQKSPLT
jgi:deoxyribodipyrimidine photo-lyase